MEPVNIDTILRAVPLFADLSSKEREIIKKKALFLEFKKGELIYAEGSNPSAFYCVCIGRIVIYSKLQDGTKKILEYLHRGKYFGIISLLTNEPHSVTAQALNDCLLLVIKKDDFDFVLNKTPRLAIDLSRTLSRRLKRKDLHEKAIFESTVISVYSSYSQAGKTVYALNLSLGLAKETHKSVIILDILPYEKVHSLSRSLEIKDYRVFEPSGTLSIEPGVLKDFILKSRFDVDLICFHYIEEDESCLQKLIGILSLLVNDYHYIILDLPSFMDRSILKILNQSDLIHILTSPEPVDLKRTGSLTKRLSEEFNFLEDKIKIIINEYKLSKLRYQTQVEMLGRDIFATLPRIDFEAVDKLILEEPDSEFSRAVRRIARYVGESLVGLVLGVGVAYGFCHIGVLRVVEEEKIPIDVIAGSSIGALIAALWAVGKPSSQILEIAGEFKEPKHIWGLVDFTIPRLGFLKGNKLRRFVKKHLGNKTFYDCKLPLKIIASDVKRKEPRILDQGLLVDAIMASCAMPGVFSPFKSKEEMLFDGGICNPLPTEPLFRLGVRKIIAVNVTPSREDVLGQYGKIKHSFKTNILDIIFSSVEILQSEVAQKEAKLADVVLHPDTSGLYWLELHKAAEFAKRGEEETRENLEKIWNLVNE